MEVVGFFMRLSAFVTFMQLAGILFGIGYAYQFGYNREWWGTPARMVQMENFTRSEAGNWYGSRPSFSGTLINNSDKELSTFWYHVTYWKCGMTTYVTPEMAGCNEVYPKIGTGNYLQEGISIKPHKSFRFTNEDNTLDYQELVQEYGTYTTVVRVTGRLTMVN